MKEKTIELNTIIDYIPIFDMVMIEDDQKQIIYMNRVCDLVDTKVFRCLRNRKVVRIGISGNILCISLGRNIKKRVKLQRRGRYQDGFGG